MICVYDIGNENYTGNGDAVLVPAEAKLKIIAGGNYDLTMTHPMDPDGKWKHLVAGAVLRVPVPEEEIENAFAGLEADVYKVTTATDLREGPTEPSTITYPAWSISADYAVGDKVSHNNKNYECTYYDETSAWAHIAPGVCNWWREITRTTPGAAVLVSLPVDSELYFVEDVDSSWYKMSTYYGIVGYVKKDKVTYDRHLTPSETKPRFITDQLLRITNATVDTKGKAVSVTAQHVSYDLNGVIIKDISIAVASPGMALARIVDGFMIPYKGTIATNLSSDGHGTYTNDIKGKSGMYALLDPDKGIVSTFSAAFRRDNWDLFVMEKTDTDKGFQLRRQKNLLGVNWTRKSDSLINRVVPVAKHEGGEDLYLPEVWVDSPRISEYPVIRMEMLTVKGEVGKDKGTGDGSVWTEEELQDEMREKATERFTVDKVDQVITEVTVDFEMLGATEEYPEMRALESVLLYDKVTVIDESIGLDTQLTVTELEWDALKKKVTAIKISNAEDRGGRSVTGYNVQAKSIGNDKLSDEVVNGIMKQVQDIIPEYADPEATRPATVEVIDGNPTLSWGNRSIVGTVQGTAMHVTMPSDPTFNPNNLSEAATDPTDNDYTMEIGATSYKLKFSRVWNYIKGKISSVLGLTENGYSGKAATAGDADTVNGKTVGTNVPANAVFTDTTYSAGTGLSLSNGAFSLKTGYTTSGKNYKVQTDNSGNPFVNVPWTDHYAWNDITDKPATATRWPTWDEVTSKPSFPYIPLTTSGGLGEANGGGSNSYFLLATLTVTGGYINSPIVFEVSRRGYGFQRLQVIFQSTSSTDPALYSFGTDGNTLGFWLVKASAGTWRLYGQYSETWGTCVVHRITGSATNNGVNVTLNLTNAGTTAPGGTEVGRFWSAGYADSAGTVPWSGVSSKPDTATRWPSWSEVTGKPNRAGSPSDGGDANSARAVRTYGADVQLGTSGTDSDDSGDIVFLYGNGQEKARLWTSNTYTSESGLNFRMFKADGTQLFTGTIPLRNTWRGYQIKEYSYTWSGSVTVGSVVNISAQQMGISTPSGYFPAALADFNYPTWCAVSFASATTTGNNRCMTATNISNSTQTTGTFTIKILYLQS